MVDDKKITELQIALQQLVGQHKALASWTHESMAKLVAELTAIREMLEDRSQH